MTGSAIWAVVPMKRTTDSKQRLAGRLSPPHRRHLALAMFTDVMTALSAARGLDGIMVVSLDPQVVEIAQQHGAQICGDNAESGHTAAVMGAARRLVADGRSGMLAIPGDIPLLTPQEIESLIAEHPPASALSIVPAHDGRGSNAILLTPPNAMPLQFGNDSFEPHLAMARRMGLTIREHRLPGIALDIDTPDDLALLEEAPMRTQAQIVLQSIKG